MPSEEVKVMSLKRLLLLYRECYARDARYLVEFGGIIRASVLSDEKGYKTFLKEMEDG